MGNPVYGVFAMKKGSSGGRAALMDGIAGLLGLGVLDVLDDVANALELLSLVVWDF
jgi:hypothetical protein